MQGVAGRGTVAWRDDLPLDGAAFAARAAEWRAALSAAPGARWALYCEDTFEFAATLFGAWHAGKSVIVPGDAQPGTLARLRTDADGFLGDLPGALAAAPEAGGADWSELDPAAPVLVVHTSGTSGEPLAIPKSLAQLDAEVHALERRFGAMCDTGLLPVNLDSDSDSDFGIDVDMAPDDAVRVQATVSHQHIYGLLFRVLWPLAAGRVFEARRLEWPEQIARSIAGPAVLVSSPALLARLPAALDWSGARAALRAVFSSGGPLTEEAAAEAGALLGLAPVEVYGSSETGGVAWRQRARHGDTWQPLPCVDVRVGADGLLQVRSPHLPDAQWRTAADRAQPAGDGMEGFELLGRGDRVVKIGEKRVSLTALERCLCATGDVAQARVWLPADGEALASAGRPVVVAELTPAGRDKLRAHGKNALVNTLREALLQGVERLALPRRWRFVEAMPVNAQGKTTLATLAALFRSARPALAWDVVEPARAVARIDVDAGLAVFDGHFPGRPVLPGVAQVDWAIHHGCERFGVRGAFRRLDKLKFQRPVEPGTALEVEWHWDAASATLRFELRSPHGVHCSGCATFALDEVAS